MFLKKLHFSSNRLTMRETIDKLFTQDETVLVSGGHLIIPNALVAAPMEANATTKIPFLSHDEIESKSPEDIRELCNQLLADEKWILANYDYTKDGNPAGVGNGVPSPLTFHKTYAQAEGGWGLVFVEATSYRPDHAARKRGLLLNEDTLPYHQKMVEGFRRFAADPEQKIMIQLTHAGWCAQDRKTFRNMFGKGANPPADEEIMGILEDIKHAATLAAQAGYDGVDVKLCHGYGLADWTLHKIRGSSGLEEVTARLHESIPIIPLICGIRDLAGRDDFAVGYRFSFFEGVPNGWGAKFDPDFTNPLTRDKLMDFYGVARDNNLSTWMVQALAPYVDFVHSSLGIPALTSELVRGTNKGNKSSSIDHLETASAIYHAMGDVNREVPVIVSNLTTGGQAVLYYISENRDRGEQPSYVSMGRGSIADFHYPNQLRDGGKEITYCSTCSQCSLPLVHQETPSGCAFEDPMKIIYRNHREMIR